MGYIMHHAIVVTSWDDERIEKAWKKAKECGCEVTAIVGPFTNGYCSFLVPPDGSKEGWDRSYEGDSARESFKAWLKENRDGNWWEWTEIRYGSDGENAEITDHAW
jgi:hypothetical protein